MGVGPFFYHYKIMERVLSRVKRIRTPIQWSKLGLGRYNLLEKPSLHVTGRAFNFSITRISERCLLRMILKHVTL